jgi:hypothetical protein
VGRYLSAAGIIAAAAVATPHSSTDLHIVESNPNTLAIPAVQEEQPGEQKIKGAPHNW